MSILINIFHKIAKNLGIVVVLMLILSRVPLLLCFLIFRSFVWLLAKYFRPDLDCFLTKENAFFAVYPPHTPNKSLNIIAAGLFNGQLNVQTIRRLFQERILNQTNDKNQFVYLRLRQTWVSFLGYAFWRTDQNFSLENHVREYDYKGELALPSPCKSSDISKLLGKLTETPWRINQSPWEILLINNFIHGESSEPKTCAILKFDHVVGDGYSVHNLLEKLFNTKFSMPKIFLKQRNFSFLEKVGLIFRVPYDLAENLLTVLLSKRIYNGELSNEVISSESPWIPVSVIKDIKNHYKVSYAAVLQFAVQGALITALKSAKMTVPKNLCCNFVLPIPNHPGGMVVHAQSIAVELPCQADSSVDRLYKTHKALKGLSNSTAGLGLLVLGRAEAYYPIILRRVFLNAMTSTGLSYVISHFPVTTSQDYIEGLEVMEMMLDTKPYLSQGISITTGGTNNQQKFTFNLRKKVFGSEEIASNLGPSVLEELKDLIEGMV